MQLLLKKLIDNSFLDKNELIHLISNMDDETLKTLNESAKDVRDREYGKKVFIRGLIEFTNYCRQNCLYCGIRSKNVKAERYRLTPEEIIETSDVAYDLGIRTFVLQGGEDNWFSVDILSNLIYEIKNNHPDCAITLSFGEQSKDTYKAYFKAGADRYLLRHETYNSNLYAKLHPGYNLKNRIECLFNLRDIGFQVGSGFMVSVPGQTDEILAEDLLFLKDFSPHMVGIGPFISHMDTPLSGYENGEVKKTLMLISIIRLLLPTSLIPATTSLSTLDIRGREKGLDAGANVVMPNTSPTESRAKYALYNGKKNTNDDARLSLKTITDAIINSGYEIDLSRGDHKGWSDIHVY